MLILQLISAATILTGLLLIAHRYRSRLYKKIGILTIALGTFFLLCDQTYMQALIPKISVNHGCTATVWEHGRIYTVARCK